ncbi:hypothetical protein LC612_33720 [Nostoc sp. CHAB 5834]|nr:hypothetical protein [Nostoc sp. CHAB 5834]
METAPLPFRGEDTKPCERSELGEVGEGFRPIGLAPQAPIWFAQRHEGTKKEGNTMPILTFPTYVVT